MEITWDEITKENQANLENVLTLYEKAFPIEVREPTITFSKSMQYATKSFPNHFRFLVGLERGQIVSFATAHYLADVNTGFIVYIFTNPIERSKGVGSKTLGKMEELLNEDAIAAGKGRLNAVILETEIAEFIHSEAEKEDCIKRANFFEKNNYKRYEEIAYLQPPLNGEEEGIPLHLFIKNNQENEMSKTEVYKIICAIYREKYYTVNGIDKSILTKCLTEMGVDSTDF